MTASSPGKQSCLWFTSMPKQLPTCPSVPKMAPRLHPALQCFTAQLGRPCHLKLTVHSTGLHLVSQEELLLCTVVLS